MTALLLPKGMAQQRARSKVEAVLAKLPAMSERDQALVDSMAAGDTYEADAPIPEGLPQPGQWRITLMPIRQLTRTRKTNLLLPNETLDVQNWTHMLWKVAAVGPLVYKGPSYQGFDPAEMEIEKPKVGELWLVDPKQPRRYRYKGILLIVVNDDQLWSRVDPDKIDGLEFQGLAL